MKNIFRILIILLALFLFSCKSKKRIYIESDHSGSFYKIVEDINEPSTLILFDLHSDSNRNILFEKKYKNEIINNNLEIVNTIRESNAVYDYNWISPLIETNIIKDVLWIPPIHINNNRALELKEDVKYRIDSDRNFKKYKVLDYETLKKTNITGPITVSIDLDYFNSYSLDKSKILMGDIFNYLQTLNKINLITVSISSHYLDDVGKDEKLLLLLLKEAKKSKYVLEFEPYYLPKEDGRMPTQFDIDKITTETKSFLLKNSKKIEVKYKKSIWNKKLQLWESEINKLNSLIDIAQNSILAEFNNKKFNKISFIEFGKKEQGIFVRLLKDGRQRGCYTFYRKVDDFEEACKLAAIDAAFFDDRETPLKKSELKENMEIEITLIDELTPIKTPMDFKLGHHTIFIVNESRRAIIQPSLVFEKNWTKEQYLSAICIKAGLDRYAWKYESTQIYKANSIWLKKPIN